MQNKKFKIGLSIVLTLLLLFTAVVGIYDYFVPDQVSVFSGESTPAYFLVTLDENPEAVPASAVANGLPSAITETSARAKLFGILPIKSVDVNYYDNIKLYPGGMPFGVKFFTQGVLVVGFTEVDSSSGKISPAYESGLRVKDIITSINGKEVNTVEEITSFIEESGGKPLSIGYMRNNTEHHTSLTPIFSTSESRYKAGVWIRDSTAGIGTVTFINPANKAFAGLGHGICDVDTGELMPLMKGSVTNVTISGITKGLAGAPGEIKGYFTGDKTGTLIGNTEAGVYGMFTEVPSGVPEGPLPIALRNQVKEGKAYIWSTLENDAPRKYEINISDINRNSNALTKSFVIKVTDPALLELSGGIVQGMSGSPIIQNGRIVGAVTHVLINDPTTGYGIFIENMLKSMPQLLK
ncbi:MAG: SpoIVB peptidase [Clostridiales bacterium]|nr:SpoIVB peptidase [Clostridiales bacterium]